HPASLQPLLGVAVQASGGLSGEVQGPLSALRTRGTLQIDGWRVADLRGQRLQGTFTAAQGPAAPQATLRVQLANVQGPSLPPSSLSVEGSFTPQQGTFTVGVTDGPYQRSQLAGKVALTQGQRLDLALTLSGTWQQPQLQGTLQLTALRWQGREYGDIQATVAHSGPTLQTEVHWRAQDSEVLQVRGTMRLDTARGLDVRLQAPAV